MPPHALAVGRTDPRRPTVFRSSRSSRRSCRAPLAVSNSRRPTRDAAGLLDALDDRQRASAARGNRSRFATTRPPVWPRSTRATAASGSASPCLRTGCVPCDGGRAGSNPPQELRVGPTLARRSAFGGRSLEAAARSPVRQSQRPGQGPFRRTSPRMRPKGRATEIRASDGKGGTVHHCCVAYWGSEYEFARTDPTRRPTALVRHGGANSE